MALVGMDRDSGLPLSGIDHVKKSIIDFLSTPVGGRVERPEYGSRLRSLVDLPINKGWISAAQAEVVRAIGRWEPRVRIKRVVITEVIDGRITMTIYGEYREDAVILELTV